MAIDTAEKRRSASAIALIWAGPGVTPSADLNRVWRQSAAWLYTGILVQGVIVDPDGSFIPDHDLDGSFILDRNLAGSYRLGYDLRGSWIRQEEL